jgi:hypothetical protein
VKSGHLRKNSEKASAAAAASVSVMAVAGQLMLNLLGGQIRKSVPPCGFGGPPTLDEARMRSMNDMYEEMAKDLCRGYRVRIGPYTARTAFRKLVG